jgi:hypothetical protein
MPNPKGTLKERLAPTGRFFPPYNLRNQEQTGGRGWVFVESLRWQCWSC